MIRFTDDAFFLLISATPGARQGEFVAGNEPPHDCVHSFGMYMSIKYSGVEAAHHDVITCWRKWDRFQYSTVVVVGKFAAHLVSSNRALRRGQRLVVLALGVVVQRHIHTANPVSYTHLRAHET